MTVLRPDQVRDQLRELEELATRLFDEYAWVYEIAYGGRSGANDAGRIRAPVSNPTQATALSAGRLRYAMREASRKIRKGHDELLKAMTALEEPFRREPADTGIPDRRSRRITPDEYREWKKYQEKRVARGQGWGAG